VSGKQDKKSRRLMSSISQAADRKVKEIERAKVLDVQQVISDYNYTLLGMPFRKRLKYAMVLIFKGKERKQQNKGKGNVTSRQG